MEYPRYFRKKRTMTDGHSFPELEMRDIGPQNIVMRLAGREIWGGRNPGMQRYLERSMYLSIFPNFTVTHVEKPPCFLRKFTPDGRHFIAFSQDQISIEVYAFKGPQAATRLFHSFKNEKEPPTWFKPSTPGKGDTPLYPSTFTPNNNDHLSSEEKEDESLRIRNQIFDSFFKLKARISVAPQGEQLNRECSLFTEDSRYMIVGSATYIQDDLSHPNFYEMYRNNESVEPNHRYPLEDYTIHVVDILHGSLSDSRSFKVDKIFLSHNQGIYLYNETLAILSVQHQTVHIFHLDHGTLQEARRIGRFCFEDDELVESAVPEFTVVPPFQEAFTNSLKQRLLVYLFKDGLNRGRKRTGIPIKEKRNVKREKKEFKEMSEIRESDESESEEDEDEFIPMTDELCRFYQYFEQLKNLRIWKMQLLDEEHLLLKYSSVEVVTLKSSEPNSQHCLFVIYDIPNAKILSVYENTSEDLVDLFEAYADNFRNNFMTPESRYTSSPSNNIFARQISQRFRQTITSARFGGPIEATKRILAQLPISAQSFSSSPYLDQALFSYDDHRVSMMERPKACGEMPIRFYGRDSGLYKFQIHAGILARSSHSGRRLVAFTFHPSAPFGISVQRANAEYLVHFHFRLDPNTLLPL